MQRITLLLFSAIVLSSPVHACDFCSCLLGINPFYVASSNLSLTFMYQNSEVTTASTPGGIAGIASSRAGLSSPGRIAHGTVLATEYRRTAELAGQVHLTDAIVVTALMPITSVTIISDSRSSVVGPGDLMLYGQYVVKGEQGSGITALLGGGIQLPTGRTDAKTPNGSLLEYRLQPGSGSTGFVLTGSAFYQLESWTIAVDLFGKLNQLNGSRNRLGHPFSAGIVGSHELYRHNPSLVAVIGSVGLRSEATGRDVIGGISDTRSGSTAHYLNAGIQIVHDFLRIDLRSLIPLAQDRPSGGANEHTRLLAGLRVVL